MEVTGSLLAVLLSVASRSSFSLCEARRSGRSGWLTVDRHSSLQWRDLWLHVVINEGFSQCLPPCTAPEMLVSLTRNMI